MNVRLLATVVRAQMHSSITWRWITQHNVKQITWNACLGQMFLTASGQIRRITCDISVNIIFWRTKDPSIQHFLECHFVEIIMVRCPMHTLWSSSIAGDDDVGGCIAPTTGRTGKMLNNVNWHLWTELFPFISFVVIGFVWIWSQQEMDMRWAQHFHSGWMRKYCHSHTRHGVAPHSKQWHKLDETLLFHGLFRYWLRFKNYIFFCISFRN